MPLLPHYSKQVTGLVCVDLQSVFCKRIPNFANCVFVANRFARLHEALPDATRYFITEQNPSRLGHTVPEVILPPSVKPMGKMAFSIYVDEIKAQLKDIEHVILFGIEGHVCMLQSVEDLLKDGHKVYLPVDGIGSQKQTDLQAALKLMATWGPNCVLSTSESLLMQLARGADDANFKKIAALLKEQHPIAI